MINQQNRNDWIGWFFSSSNPFYEHLYQGPKDQFNLQESCKI